MLSLASIRLPSVLYAAQSIGSGVPPVNEVANSACSSFGWTCQTRIAPSSLAVTTSLPSGLKFTASTVAGGACEQRQLEPGGGVPDTRPPAFVPGHDLLPVRAERDARGAWLARVKGHHRLEGGEVVNPDNPVAVSGGELPAIEAEGGIIDRNLARQVQLPLLWPT